MNRSTCSLLVCLLLCVIPCAAQTKRRRPKPHRVSNRIELVAVVDEHFPEAWQRFTSAEGSFSILFPGQPKHTTQVENDGPVSITTHRILFVSRHASYEARFVDLPYQVDSPEKVKGVFDAIRTDLIASTKGQPLSESDITIAGHPGKQTVWKTQDGMLLKAEYLLSGNRVFWLLFGVTEDNNLPAEIREFRESIAKKFFDSFTISSAP